MTSFVPAAVAEEAPAPFDGARIKHPVDAVNKKCSRCQHKNANSISPYGYLEKDAEGKWQFAEIASKDFQTALLPQRIPPEGILREESSIFPAAVAAPSWIWTCNTMTMTAQAQPSERAARTFKSDISSFQVQMSPEKVRRLDPAQVTQVKTSYKLLQDAHVASDWVTQLSSNAIAARSLGVPCVYGCTCRMVPLQTTGSCCRTQIGKSLSGSAAFASPNLLCRSHPDTSFLKIGEEPAITFKVPYLNSSLENKISLLQAVSSQFMSLRKGASQVGRAD